MLLFVVLMRRAAGAGAGGLMSFGRARARRAEEEEQTVTFADVAGIDEAKEELTEIVDFLKNPQKYVRLGGKIPRGVLLSGAPGTGKTLLARAVAGEAGVPFFHLSASEFVEMIVGVGASRVRDLFAQAKAAAPAIIFIDELDAVGRSRAAGGANISRRTRRARADAQPDPDRDGRLRPAPGRDRARRHQPPGDPGPGAAAGRGGSTAVSPCSHPTAQVARRSSACTCAGCRSTSGSSVERIAASTPGMVGADLANLVNEAALLAARREHERVTSEDFSAALERIVLGAERKVMLSEEDRRRIAYHESGHAIVGMLTPGADPVRKVSIIPRGQSLGVTFSAPDADRFNFEERYLLAQIKVALGGRVAEELVFGDMTTGAESDIQHLTQIARQMVGRWGMSRVIGPVAVIPMDGIAPVLARRPRDLRVDPAPRRRGGPADRRVRPPGGLEPAAQPAAASRFAGRRAARARDALRGPGLRGRGSAAQPAKPVSSRSVPRWPTSRPSRRAASSARAPRGTRPRAA